MSGEGGKKPSRLRKVAKNVVRGGVSLALAASITASVAFGISGSTNKRIIENPNNYTVASVQLPEHDGSNQAASQALDSFYNDSKLSAPSASETIDCMTYNIKEIRSVLENEVPIYDIAKTIAETDAKVVGLQEARADLIEELVQRLHEDFGKDYNYVFAGNHSRLSFRKCPQIVGNALLVDSESEIIFYSNEILQKKSDAKVYKTCGRRGVLETIIDLDGNRKTLDPVAIYNTHLNSRDVPANELEAEEIVEIAKARQEGTKYLSEKDTYAAIILGDFNRRPGSKTVKTVNNYFNLCKLDDKTPTFPLCDSRIDYIGICGKDAKIIKYSVDTGNKASDHVPVYVNVTNFRGSPTSK